MIVNHFLNESSQTSNPCLDGSSCFTNEQYCDGICNCLYDCYDETNCPETNQRFFRPIHERFNPKIERIYQLSWLWEDQFTLPDGRVQFRAEMSKDIANYVVSFFAVSRLAGFGLLKSPIHISSVRQFYIQVEIPDECRLGINMIIILSYNN